MDGEKLQEPSKTRSPNIYAQLTKAFVNAS